MVRASEAEVTAEVPRIRAPRARRAARAVAAVTFGDRRRIGLWILPLFLLTALIAATLAGGLTVLYYAQRVRGLEETTASARAEVAGARDEVTGAAEEARTAIEELVTSARDELAVSLPVGNPAEHGIYAVSAAHAGGETRVGSAFVIFSDAQQTFLATTHRLVSVGDGRSLATVDVFMTSGPAPAAVHGVDPAHDLAVLVLEIGEMPLLEWRPPDEALVRGDRVYLAGVAGQNAPAVLEGMVGAVSPEAIVASQQVNDFLAGGPLLDTAGRVVGVASVAYAPFGRVAGDPIYSIPVRALCVALVQCTATDLGEAGGVDAPPAEFVPAPEARPPTTPTVSPRPAPSS